MPCCAVHHVQAPKKLAEAIQDDRLVMEHMQAFLRPPEPRWALGSMGTSCGGGRLGAWARVVVVGAWEHEQWWWWAVGSMSSGGGGQLGA